MLLAGMPPFMAPSDEGVKLKIKWARVREQSTTKSMLWHRRPVVGPSTAKYVAQLCAVLIVRRKPVLQ